MSFKYYGLEITKVTNVKNIAMNVQASINYVTVLSKLNKIYYTNTGTDKMKIKDNLVVIMGENEYDVLHKLTTKSNKSQMMDCYNKHSIIIKHGFMFGAYFNISCREWNMLMSKEWLIDNFMNIALALLQKKC